MQNLWKKKLKGKKKVGTKCFRSHSLFNHGFPTDFFLFFFDFQTLRLTRYYSCIFWQPKNTLPSLYNVHVHAAVWPLFFEPDLSIRSPARWQVGRKVAGDMIELHIYIEDFLFKAF